MFHRVYQGLYKKNENENEKVATFPYFILQKKRILSHHVSSTNSNKSAVAKQAQILTVGQSGV
jgi:hypothetical protein